MPYRGDPEKARERQRRWYYAHADQVRESVRRYRLANIEKIRAYDRARGFRETDHQKTAARMATRVLRKQGPHDCENCGAPDAHAHHDDYSQPLDVRWLCRACHGIEHRRPFLCPAGEDLPSARSAAVVIA
jgi:ribosomal protein S27AE